MSKLIDLTGQRFGKLTVESQATSAADKSARWNCRCDCGNTCIIRGRSLRQGKVKDCGCENVRFYDLTGKRFGHLTAEVKLPPSKDGKTRWQCSCDCGNICTVTSLELRNGQKTDCGCITKSHAGNFEIIDLTGKRFGKLFVLAKAPTEKDGRTRWICQCDCSNAYVATSQALRKGFAKSCGCGRKKDITGMRFGHLTAIERSEQYIVRNKYGKRYLWKCNCDCGNIVYRLPEKLRDDIDSACDDCLSKLKVASMVENAGFVEGTQLAKIVSIKPTAANTSGVRGVIWNKRTQKWRAMLVFQRTSHYLGEYREFNDAVNARKAAEEKYYLPFLEKHKV